MALSEFERLHEEASRTLGEYRDAVKGKEEVLSWLQENEESLVSMMMDRKTEMIEWLNLAVEFEARGVEIEQPADLGDRRAARAAGRLR